MHIEILELPLKLSNAKLCSLFFLAKELKAVTVYLFFFE